VSKTEALLNLVWVLMCVGALGLHFWRSRAYNVTQTRAARVRRTLSVLIAAVALFPCISASDDRVRLSDIQNPPVTSTQFNRTPIHGSVLSILEDPEHGQTAAPLFLAFMLSYFVMVRAESPALTRWFPLSSLGRAPPVGAVAHGVASA
jgi:hypothetical protein